MGAWSMQASALCVFMLAVPGLWSGPGKGVQCLAFSVAMVHFVAGKAFGPG